MMLIVTYPVPLRGMDPLSVATTWSVYWVWFVVLTGWTSRRIPVESRENVPSLPSAMLKDNVWLPSRSVAPIFPITVPILVPSTTPLVTLVTTGVSLMFVIPTTTRRLSSVRSGFARFVMLTKSSNWTVNMVLLASLL